jgi:hypothetical protein
MEVRTRSVMVMTSDVFMKRIRTLTMGLLFNDEELAGRRVAFLVYDLMRKWKNWTVSDAQIAVAKQANDMPTTLWATEEELRTLIACGQNTACLKLLLQLEDRERVFQKLTPDSIQSREKLQAMWTKLQANPYALCDERLERR